MNGLGREDFGARKNNCMKCTTNCNGVRCEVLPEYQGGCHSRQTQTGDCKEHSAYDRM